MDQAKAVEMVATIVARLERRAVSEQVAPTPEARLAYEAAARLARTEANLAGIATGQLQAAVNFAHSELAANGMGPARD